MKIYQVNLDCQLIHEMKEFYTRVLGMELIAESEQAFAVMAGSTKLHFIKKNERPYYHVCFRTGSGHFETMLSNLNQLGLLLPDGEGNCSMFWNGKQAYFSDPDGNVLEMLERPQNNDLLQDWHDVGEIGLPSADVTELQGFLSELIPNEIKKESKTFSFFGDQAGVFVIVKEGRNWYPTERAAKIHPITAIVSGKTEGQLTPPNLPYKIIVKKEWGNFLPVPVTI